MKTKLLTLILVISTQIVFSQPVEWKKNILQWDHFLAEPDFSTLNQSQIYYSLGYNSKKIRKKDTIINTIVAIGQIDPALSWVKPESKNEQLLKYNQVVFDIAELYRRKLELVLLKSHPYSYDVGFKFQVNECNKMVSKMGNETQNGTDSLMVEAWSEKISNQLDSLPEFSYSDLKFGKLEYEIGIGAGFNTFGNELADVYKNHFSLEYVLNLSYKKVNFLTSLYMGSTKTEQDINYNAIQWSTETRLNCFEVGASLGYTLWSNERHRLIPFLGINFFEVSRWDKTSSSEELQNITSNTNFHAGLYYNYSFLKSFNFLGNIYMPYYKEAVDYGVFSKLFVSSIKMENAMNGLILNFSVGLTFRGRKIIL